MTKTLLLLSLIIFSKVSFSQDKQRNPLTPKKDTAHHQVIPAKKDTIPPITTAPRQKVYAVMLSEDEIIRMYSIIRTSGTMTGTDIEQYLILLDQRKKEIKQ